MGTFLQISSTFITATLCIPSLLACPTELRCLTATRIILKTNFLLFSLPPTHPHIHIQILFTLLLWGALIRLFLKPYCFYYTIFDPSFLAVAVSVQLKLTESIFLLLLKAPVQHLAWDMHSKMQVCGDLAQKKETVWWVWTLGIPNSESNKQ